MQRGIDARFLLRLCHLQLPLWLATPLRPVPFLRQCFDILHGWLDLDHASPEGLGDAGTHARFGRRLMLATGYVMVPPLLACHKSQTAREETPRSSVRDAG